MKKALTLLLSLAMLFSLAACGQSGGDSTDDAPSTLVYGSADYTRIDPAMDEHCEINLLLFNGLTAHDGNDQIVPALAERWDYDEANCTYTFYLREDVKWHDGGPFTAQDVKFTIEAIMDPDNGSENAPNYEDVQEITVLDDHTVSFRLAAAERRISGVHDDGDFAAASARGQGYAGIRLLPRPRRHRSLQARKLGRRAVHRARAATRTISWARRTSSASSSRSYPTTTRRRCSSKSGEIDLALLDPKNAQNFAGKEGYTCYDMTTADYRGILFNFNNPYWTENRDIIPAVCYAIDRQAIVDSVLLGQGMAALQSRSSAMSTTTRDREPLRLRSRKSAKKFLNPSAARWAIAATTSETARRLASSSASCPASRTASTSRRPRHSSLEKLASTARWTSPRRWTGAARWHVSSAGAARLTPTTTPTRSSARIRARTTRATRTRWWTNYLTLARQSSDRTAVRKEYYSKFLHALGGRSGLRLHLLHRRELCRQIHHPRHRRRTRCSATTASAFSGTFRTGRLASKRR